MTYLAQRKWFALGLVAALASIGFRIRANQSAADAAIQAATTVRSVADDSEPADVLDEIKPSVQDIPSQADWLGLLSLGMLVGSLGLVLLSLMKKESTKPELVAPLLVVAVLLQIVTV